MERKIVCVLLTCVLLVGCETWGGQKQTAGTLIGGAAGAIIGAQFGGGSGQVITGAVGALVGAQVGAIAGRHMDDQDKKLAGETAYYGLERQRDLHVSNWHNPNTAHSGQFVVINTHEDLHRQVVCRDFVHMIKMDGENSKVRGRACRDMHEPNGEWVLVN